MELFVHRRDVLAKKTVIDGDGEAPIEECEEVLSWLIVVASARVSR